MTAFWYKSRSLVEQLLLIVVSVNIQLFRVGITDIVSKCLNILGLFSILTTLGISLVFFFNIFTVKDFVKTSKYLQKKNVFNFPLILTHSQFYSFKFIYNLWPGKWNPTYKILMIFWKNSALYQIYLMILFYVL